MDDIPIVDPHHHFWDLSRNRHPWLQDDPPTAFRYGDYSPLKTNFLPADYERVSAAFRVVATVTVEAEWDPQDPVGETRWIDAVSTSTGKPHGHIAQAWLDRADVADVLAAQAAYPIVRGVRHKPRAAARPDLVVRGASGSMSDPRWRKGYRLLQEYGLHFELQVPWWHAREALDLVEAFPETLLVLNHAGLPGSRDFDVLKGWREGMELLAQAPNVSVKISGLGLKHRPWSLNDNREVIRDVIAIFGTDRAMFASNFPVDGLCGSFDTIYRGFRAAVADLSPADQRKLFHDNAIRVYRLSGWLQSD
jgi:predicted TIM-barrel fold metal-dependent hydrolase